MADSDFHPVTLSTDTTDLKAGPISRMSDAVAKGLPAAAISGGLSVWNTFLDYAGKDQVNVAQTIRAVDQEMGDYYTENQAAVDMVGFVGTSLVPGALGMKALKIARAGNTEGAIGRALNMAASKKHEYLAQAVKETAESGGTVRSIFTATRAKQLAWAGADEAMLAAAGEIAIVATMNDSPVFQGDTIGDFAFNVALGSGIGGVAGGLLSSIGAKGVLKDVSKQVDFQKRVVDTVFDPEKMGLTKGTETLLFAENISKLPDDFLNLKHTYTYDGVTKTVQLDTAAMLAATKDRAVKTANDQLSLKFNELAEGNALIGQEYFAFVKRGMVAAKESGLSADETVGVLNGYLNNVTKITNVDMNRMELDTKKFYVNIEPTGLTDMFSLKRTPTTGKVPYRLADGTGADELKVASLVDTGFDSLHKAWRGGVDADILMVNGRPAINPYSEKIKRLNENPNRVRMFVDTETGTVADQTVVHFADTIVHGKLSNTTTAIESGTKVYVQGAKAATDLTKAADVGSARFAWASKFTINEMLRVSGGSIDAADLPMLSRLSELAPTMSADTLAKFSITDAKGVTSAAEILDFPRYVLETKYAQLAEQLGKGEHYDLRHIAAHFNTSVDWLDDAIARNFTPPSSAAGQAIPDLPTVDALRPKNIQVEWDFSAVAKKMIPEEAYKQQFGPAFQATQELSRFYQLQIREVVGTNAFVSVLGKDAAMFMDAPKDLAKQTGQEGAGATALGASNAGYGETAKLFVQDMGKNVSLLTQRFRDAVVETLAPNVNALRNSPQATMELGVLTNALRKSEFRYTFSPENPNQLISTQVAELMRREEVDVATALEMIRVSSREQPRVPHTLDVKSPEVVDFLRTSTRINTARQSKFNVLNNAIGITRKESGLETIYVPPVNTVKYPFHAFVRTKEQIGIASETTMITARTEEALREQIAKLGDNYDVFFKKDTEMYFKAKGEYEYERSINEARINSDLARKGVLADVFPETNLQNIMEDWLGWHAKQEEKLVRNAVQVKHRQFFSEMRLLSDNYRVVSESTARGIGSMFKKKVEDPFGDYIKTALNISKQQEFPLLDSLNELVDKVGLAAGDAFAKAWEENKAGKYNATMGPKPWEEADAIAKRFGLGTPYSESSDAVQAYIQANTNFPRNLIRESFQKANMMLANFTLRLDFANSLVNIISTPIMLGTEMQSIKKLIKEDSALAGKLAELRNIQVPGQDFSAPSTIKLIAGSINNFFGKDKAALIKRYQGIGAMKDVSQLYHQMLDDLSFNATTSPNHWYNTVNGAVDKMAKYTGNDFSEDLTRFVSADVMKQLTDPVVEAGKMTAKEQNAYISTFVNRVQGNYVTSQRPVVFQGTSGAAVSLFQTYAFNVLQQLHRHVEAGDKRTLAVYAGLQSSIFGMNGLPFFDAVNTHLIGGMVANNPEHKDAYSVLPGFNKELGDWMLYGTASAFPLFTGSAPALYSRGDINPRHWSILPTNPLDVPAVSASLKLAKTVYDFGKNVAGGVDLSSAMLHGLEHQGWNRPLAGFAQLLGGRSTTSQGNLISAANDMQATSWLGSLAERTVEFGGVARLMGARPMDEAVALNAIYRQKGYDALDKERISRLGSRVKTKLYGGEVPTDDEMDDFMESYTRSGGRIENFSQSMQRWMKDANSSVVNQMAHKLGRPSSRKLQSIMGGEDLPDYWNAPAADPMAQTE